MLFPAFKVVKKNFPQKIAMDVARLCVGLVGLEKSVSNSRQEFCRCREVCVYAHCADYT